jgi:hypothetical protein
MSQEELPSVIGSRKPFPSDIEHFRNKRSAECSVKNHELFEGLGPEFSRFSETKLTYRKWSRSRENGLMTQVNPLYKLVGHDTRHTATPL